MAENLRKLVSSEFLRTLYENLERWQRDYNVSRRRRRGAGAGLPRSSSPRPPPGWGGVVGPAGGVPLCKAPGVATPAGHVPGMRGRKGRRGSAGGAGDAPWTAAELWRAQPFQW